MSETLALPDVPTLPCPFCGGPVVTFTRNGSGYQISCEAACAETPWYETVDGAKAWWNTRALPSTALAARPEEGLREPSDALAFVWTYNYLSERAQALGESHDEDELRESAADIVAGYKKYRPAPSTPPTAGDGHD